MRGLRVMVKASIFRTDTQKAPRLMKTFASCPVRESLARRAAILLTAGTCAALAAVAGPTTYTVLGDTFDGSTRPTGSQVVLTEFGPGSATTSLQLEDVSAKVTISNAQSYSGHQLGVIVELSVAPGWHIYGEPLPQEYTPTKVKFDDSLVERQALKFPPPVQLRFEALDQTFPVYHGDIKATGNLVLKQKLKPGEYKLAGTIEFQECNDSMCKLPQSAHFELPLTIKPVAAPASKT